MNIKINLIYAQHRYSNISLLSYIACKKKIKNVKNSCYWRFRFYRNERSR